MYPYDFVRIDWNKGVQRRPSQPHNHFTGLAGRIEGTITTLMPFFLPETDPRKARFAYKPFLTNGKGQAIVPGSSLKGLIRSLVETIGPGCWWLFDKTYEHVDYGSQLPRTFQQCSDTSQLCVACRMFGLIKGNNLLLGHVGFEDAVCAQPIPHDPLYTIILGSPKPRHRAFYLTPDGRQVAGRKFYYHHSVEPANVGGWLPKGRATSQANAQNQYIKPIGTGSAFTFSAHFDNLAADELALLLYALVLEPGMRHKLGYAKSAGFGSAEIKLTGLELVDYTTRYTSPTGGTTRYEGETLQKYLAGQIAPYANNAASITLQDLRRIWAWPGRNDLRFPEYGWFHGAGNGTKRLSETP